MGAKYFHTITKTISEESGEVLNETSEITGSFTKQIAAERPYLKIYYENVDLIERLPGRQIDVLLELLQMVDYDNRFSVPASKKREMCIKLKMFKKGTEEPSLNWFNGSLAGLAKRGVVKNLKGGTYQMNPFIIAKGNWKTIQKWQIDGVNKTKDKGNNP